MSYFEMRNKRQIFSLLLKAFLLGETFVVVIGFLDVGAIVTVVVFIGVATVVVVFVALDDA